MADIEFEIPILPSAVSRDPTINNLRTDAAKIAQQVVDAWENQVDCVVILVPKNPDPRSLTTDIACVGSIAHLPLFQEVLRCALRAVPRMKSITSRIKR